MIDIHAHLDDEQFDADRQEVIARAFKKGVSKIINIGAGLGSSERSVILAKKNRNIYAAVGCHPHYFMKHKTWNMKHKKQLEDLAQADKTVAIGEIGLDYFSPDGKIITKRDKKIQRDGFIYQLNLAKKLNLPVIIHCRGARAENGKKYRETEEAYKDVLKIIENYTDLKFVLHSFAGRLKFTEEIIGRQNIIFSFTGNITYAKPQAEILEVIQKIPLEKIMIETDCPYLAPVPMRGKRNEPAWVKYVAKKVGEIKKVDQKEVERITTKNAEKLFQI